MTLPLPKQRAKCLTLLSSQSLQVEFPLENLSHQGCVCHRLAPGPPLGISTLLLILPGDDPLLTMSMNRHGPTAIYATLDGDHIDQTSPATSSKMCPWVLPRYRDRLWLAIQSRHHPHFFDSPRSTGVWEEGIGVSSSC